MNIRFKHTVELPDMSPDERVALFDALVGEMSDSDFKAWRAQTNYLWALLMGLNARCD